MPSHPKADSVGVLLLTAVGQRDAVVITRR